MVLAEVLGRCAIVFTYLLVIPVLLRLAFPYTCFTCGMIGFVLSGSFVVFE